MSVSIKQILTKRNTVSESYWDIVFEWEDALARVLGLPVRNDFYSSKRWYQGFMRRFPDLLAQLRPASSLVYVMNPIWDYAYSKKGVIPCIVDFYIRDKEGLLSFARNFRHCPLVLISSCEAEVYLRQTNCPLNIRHWGLGLADKWITPPSKEKKFDLVIVGRTNPVFEEYLHRYICEHPEFTCVRSRRENGEYICRTQNGEIVGKCDTRSEYMEMLSKSRLALYSTPSIDRQGNAECGFNQVTPRFLEFLASGCHVLSRFPDNADTRYYNLAGMSYRVQTYDQFSSSVTELREKPFDWPPVEKYLLKHSMSARGRELMELMKGFQ